MNVLVGLTPSTHTPIKNTRYQKQIGGTKWIAKVVKDKAIIAKFQPEKLQQIYL